MHKRITASVLIIAVVCVVTLLYFHSSLRHNSAKQASPISTSPSKSDRDGANGNHLSGTTSAPGGLANAPGQSAASISEVVNSVPKVFLFNGVVISSADKKRITDAIVKLVVQNEKPVITEKKVNENGAFSFEAPGGYRYEIYASAPGFKEYLERGLQVDRSYFNLEIPLDPYLKLEGKVLDSRSNPIVGAIVTASHEPGKRGWVATSSRGGYFEIADIPEEGKYFVRARHSSFTMEDYAVVLVPEDASLILRMKPVVQYGNIEIKCIDSKGRPVAGAEIRLTEKQESQEKTEDANTRISASIVSDNKGFGRLEKVKVGDYGFTVLRVQGYKLVRAPNEGLQSVANITKQFEFTFDPDSVPPFLGVVVNERNEPIAGAVIWARTSDPKASGLGAGKTDEEGRFRFVPSNDVVYTLSVTHRDYVSLKIPEMKPSETELRLVMNSGLTLAGSTSESNGNPVEKFRLHFLLPDTKEEVKALSFTAIDGQFAARGLPPGNYQLVLELPNKESYQTQLELDKSMQVIVLLDTERREIRILKH